MYYFVIYFLYVILDKFINILYILFIYDIHNYEGVAMKKENEIGIGARELDTKLTTIERMKIKKGTIGKIGISILFYFGAMGLMAVLL